MLFDRPTEILICNTFRLSFQFHFLLQTVPGLTPGRGIVVAPKNIRQVESPKISG